MNTSFLLAERDSAFRMRRPTLKNGGFVTDTDPDVERRLAELDDLLGRAVLPAATERKASSQSAGRKSRSEKEDGNCATDPAGADTPQEQALRELLERPLSPWVPKGDGPEGSWPKGSLGRTLSKASGEDSAITLSDFLEQKPELSTIKMDVEAKLSAKRFALDGNARAVLDGRENIRDYLIARAYYEGQRKDSATVYNYIIGHSGGVESIVDYAAISAGRAIIARKHLDVPNYRDDDEGFANSMRSAPVALSKASFAKTLDTVASNLMFNTEASELLKSADDGDKIPEELKPKLIRYIQTSKFPITKQNIDLFLPSFLSRAYEYEPDAFVEDPGTADDTSYAVQFKDVPDTSVDVDRDAVRYAAQLFHGMVLGEELGVFDAFQYLLHSRMLVGGGMQVRDKSIREDLRLYTLSNEFRDLGRPGHPPQERTRASERKMFSRQVFAQGDGELIEGMAENGEFRQLWQILMLESARYLERAQEAFNPTSFVSKQNVMQAIEDLQYNLSTHCVGWAQVMAPAIDAELNYVLTRFIGNEKIASQVLPAGGSWKRVIDKLNTERPKQQPISAAALLYAKAWQGAAILNSIAEYSSAGFENEGEFSEFISLVDAYITTESKLQRRPSGKRTVPDPSSDEEDEESNEASERPRGAEREPTPANTNDEWDF